MDGIIISGTISISYLLLPNRIGHLLNFLWLQIRFKKSYALGN